MPSAALFLEDRGLRLPADVLSLEGFQRWVHSPSSAPQGVSFLGGKLYFEPDLLIPSDVLSLDGFLRWVHSPEFPEHCRASFLAGEVSIDMSPEELVTHNLVKTDVGADMVHWNRRHDRGLLFSDRALFVDDEIGISTEPDLMFCLWSSLRSGRVRLVEKVEGSDRFVQLHGSPDLIVEIIGDTSVYKDTFELPPLYFAAGVKEYWLIDARAPKLDFRLHTRGRNAFVPVKPDAQRYQRSRVLRGAFRLTRMKAPVGAQYRLLAKS